MIGNDDIRRASRTHVAASTETAIHCDSSLKHHTIQNAAESIRALARMNKDVVQTVTLRGR